ncbi:hypothetical protein EVAR_67175_1 [Eumeta japonica]|uniref:Uncharacterized protein n=1 Tax=Eumeta variegata TaxID=151549 RepID=A0A4C1ZSA4_EUMVA|nr:hypothetical protein EVAR_67175_1 [Eumeta japonica]
MPIECGIVPGVGGEHSKGHLTPMTDDVPPTMHLAERGEASLRNPKINDTYRVHIRDVPRLGRSGGRRRYKLLGAELDQCQADRGPRYGAVVMKT